MSEASYRIVHLVSENVKRLKAVSITPEGNVVEISGSNGAGKSSLLDSIFFALAGQKYIQSQPIRNGADKGLVEIDLGDIIVRRTFKRQEDNTFTTALIVETKDGARFQKPQDILNKLVGELTYDPLEFTRKKPAEQFDILKGFVSGFDFDGEARERKRLFDERTDVNRRVKELKSQVAGISIADDTPEDEIDVSALTDELQAVGDFNADIHSRSANRQRVSDEADRLEIEAKQLEARAAELLAQAEEKRGAAAERREKLANAGSLPELKDPSEIRAKIESANIVNESVRRKRHRDQLIAQAEKLEKDAAALTKGIDDADARKAEAIAKAEIPVPGLGFGDGEILLNGLPFDQASSAEQLRASVAMAMAANTKLRVILIRDGSLLDRASFAILDEMAKENDFQVFIEVVESDRPGAIIIEDGSVKEHEVLEAAE